MSNEKKDVPEAHGKLKAARSRLSHEDLPRPMVELPKREERGDYKEADYPFKIISEVF
jgi:hypothetical protein